MCIRDRPNPRPFGFGREKVNEGRTQKDHHPAGGGGGAFPPDGAQRQRETSDQAGGHPEPVSYTHLDVYKRQVWGGRGRRGKA